MKIGIIGGLGVGAAHALSALKLGHYVHLFDLANKMEIMIERWNGPELYNAWGPIKDILPNSYKEKLELNYLEQLRWLLPFLDLVIIASPTDTHMAYIEKIKKITPKLTILCEKPITRDLADLVKLSNLDVHCSLEWMHHPRLKEGWLPHVLSYSHSYSHPDEHPILDLGIHLISIVFATWGLGLSLHSVSQEGNWYGCVLRKENNSISLGVGFVESKISEPLLDGRILEWIPFAKQDLFARQLQSKLIPNLQPDSKMIPIHALTLEWYQRTLSLPN